MKAYFFYFIFTIISSTMIYPQINLQELQETKNLPSTSSKQIPNLEQTTQSFLEKLEGTVWMTTDRTKNIDYYVFFHEGKQGAISIPRGQNPKLPSTSFPLKFIQLGSTPNSAIILVTSKDKILYYSMRLITPYFLVISAGYNTMDNLIDIAIEDYFKDGYILQIVY